MQRDEQIFLLIPFFSENEKKKCFFPVSCYNGGKSALYVCMTYDRYGNMEVYGYGKQ